MYGGRHVKNYQKMTFFHFVYNIGGMIVLKDDKNVEKKIIGHKYTTLQPFISL